MPFQSTVECSECGNRLWEKYGCPDGKAACANCGHERDYTPKSARVDDGYTSSQEKRLGQIRSWFNVHTTTDPEDIYSWEENFSPHGGGRLSLIIDTDEHPLINERYHFMISRHGKVMALNRTANRVLNSLYRSKDKTRRCTR
jgi:hypothetical protein